MGVLAPLVGVMGSMQAAEALKLIVGMGTSLSGQLLMLDGRNMQWSSMRARRNTDCPVCAQAV
jgi:molybdopterin/thiamine biosynthesis adenylyltransferase